ncbi:Carotenoid cleavage dioxygenase 7 chloroplastic isoform 1 [Tripterygium wilfordii]|uniref:Carotenoid cleavage dioxygenase 7 chloroplastic isoform 1 n=1 Tax=Tripterygium wilfordii TaxID=458696 RepID=A0A7J7CBW4_TRIWF|nr:carotenoid cleavage dioxygenase 7, chloroplastic [Tripterygium wilfordii]KAF5731628.1 Carotenoid cleavage dioxygenase 7 chloroplastic isoform 1 [Tripterygium wilfordii]
MQAKPCHIIPAAFRSPEKLSPAHRLYSPANIPRAISIATPDNNRVRTVTTERTRNYEEDEATAAFWDYQFLFVSQRSETVQPVKLQVVDGAIPSDFPSGTYYLAGPGIFSDDYGSTVHPLDGHGYLRSFTFDGVKGDVNFMAKYVRTEAQEEEFDHATGTWRFTHRGPFSVLKKGKKLGNTKVMKNVANTSVLKWGGRLLCLWEGGDPYEIESGTLDTVGRFDMINGSDSLVNSNGSVDGGDVWEVAARLLKPILHGVFNMPAKRMLSHYKVDARRNRLLTVSCNAEDMLLPRSNFTFYEHDSDFKLLQMQEFNIPDHLMIHDWAFTDTHYILFSNRIKLDVIGSMGAVCGLSPMISALSVNPSKASSPIYLLPRFPNESSDSVGGRDWRVPVEVDSQFWLQHVGNAFEVKDQNGNLDIHIQAVACSYHWFNFQSLFGYNWQSGKLDPSIMNVKEGDQTQLLPHLIQVSIKLDAEGSCYKACVEPLNEWNKSSDFPLINQSFSGYENKYIYAAASSGSRRSLPSFPFDMVVKLDLKDKSARTWSTGRRRFIGEPIFVPKDESEDDGYLLVVEYAVSIQKCYLVILDPKRIGEGDALVARIMVPKHLNFPLGFHGFWAINHD